MSDALSQEQIDALLSAENLGSGSGFGLDPQTDSVDKNVILERTCKLFCNQATNIISNVLNKKIEFSTEIIEGADISSIQESLNTAVLLLKMPLKSGLDGEFFLLAAKNGVAVLSDLMMMGDGGAEYSEDHKDAMCELMNQVMGAFSNSLGTEFNIQVSSDSVEASEFDLDNPPFSLDSFDMAIVSISIDGMDGSNAVFLISSQISDQLVQLAPSSDISDGQDSGGRVLLNMEELDDLSKVTSFDSENDFRETSFSGEQVTAPRENIEMLLDVDLDVSIELGRSSLSIKRILELAPGAIVELDRMAGEPVDLLVNNKVVAKGEVVVIDESFGIRIVSLVSPEERIKSLR